MEDGVTRTERPDLLAHFAGTPVERVVACTFDNGDRHGMAVEFNRGGKLHRYAIRYDASLTGASVEALRAMVNG